MSNLEGLSRAVQARLAALHGTAIYRTSGTALAQPADMSRRVAVLLDRQRRRAARAARRSAVMTRG